MVLSIYLFTAEKKRSESIHAATRLEKLALALLLFLGEEHSLDGLIEDGLEVITVLRRALQVTNGLDLLRESIALLGSDGRLTACLQLVDSRSVRAKIDLRSDEDLRNIGAEVNNLRVPLQRVNFRYMHPGERHNAPWTERSRTR